MRKKCDDLTSLPMRLRRSSVKRGVMIQLLVPDGHSNNIGANAGRILDDKEGRIRRSITKGQNPLPGLQDELRQRPIACLRPLVGFPKSPKKSNSSAANVNKGSEVRLDSSRVSVN